jgi:hypothetical protein
MSLVSYNQGRVKKVINFCKKKDNNLITIPYHKFRLTPELKRCVERENDGAFKRRAFYIDACRFKVIGIPVSLNLE